MEGKNKSVRSYSNSPMKGGKSSMIEKEKA